MRKTDLIGDLRAGLSLLTRLPLPPPARFPTPPACWAWPLAGLVVGGLATAGGLAALALGLPAGLAAVIVLMLGTLATGALHEDGLADCADGFWGGWTKDRRLEIMKDSHIGSYGVMALLLVTLARWSAASALLAAGHWPALLAAATLSRVPMVVLMASLPNARGSGLAASVGRPGRKQVAAAALLALGLGCGLTGVMGGATGAATGLAMALATAAAGLALAWTARVKIGGQTGDVLGASQQLSDLAALSAAVALIGV